MHTPVLLQETIEALKVEKGRKYIDATFGLGGHSKEICAKGGIVLGIEWDETSFQAQKEESLPETLSLVQGNFADIEQISLNNGFQPVHGVLFDLGLSMWQIRESGRGFSYENDDEVLNMRIGSDAQNTAADIINSYSEDQLYDIFTKYAEELNSRAIAQAIVRSRRVKRVHTVGELKHILQSVTKDQATLARIFQALRIEVNNEFENIQKALDGAFSILDSDGRIVVITFHPSEDRIVKKWIREHKRKTDKKALKAKQGKKFERSALMRIIYKS